MLPVAPVMAMAALSVMVVNSSRWGQVTVPAGALRRPPDQSMGQNAPLVCGICAGIAVIASQCSTIAPFSTRHRSA